MQRKQRPQIWIIYLANHAILHVIENMWAIRLDWSPDGVHIAVSGAQFGPSIPDLDVIRIYDAQSGNLVAHFPFGLPHPLIRYTPDGKYVIESNLESIRIWDGQHRTILQEISREENKRDYDQALAVSRDGRYFAVSQNNKVFVWQLR